MNYINPDLCVSGISSIFGLSESYFSQFFKEQTGENFSAYLENKRIKHACELLDTTDKSVNEYPFVWAITVVIHSERRSGGLPVLARHSTET